MSPRLDADRRRAVRAAETTSKGSTPAEARRTAPSLTEGHGDPLALLPQGAHVFPIWPTKVGEDGERYCTCSDDECDNAGKHPALKWTKYATASPAHVRRWREKYPGANFGVACGPSEIVVLDEDEMGEFQRLCEAYGQDVPVTYTVRTSKGRHFWFLAPDDEIRNSNMLRDLGYEIDVRGAGGFVVAPCSTHATGATYEVVDDTDPQPLPGWVCDLLTTRDGQQATTPDDEDRPATAAQAWAALEGACDDLAETAEGGRNILLNSKALYLGRFVGAGLLDRADVEEALTDAAHAAGLADDEIRKTLKSGLDAGIERPRMVAPEDTHAESEPGLVALDWTEAWRQYREGGSTEEWIVYPILPQRRLVVLYSLPKVGKSLLMLEVAIGISCGAEVLGSTPPRPFKVLYVDYENDPMGDLLPRLEAMGHDESLNLSNLHLLSFPVLGGLDTKRGAERLLGYIDVNGIEVVVIDTVSRAVDGPENDNDTWLNMYRHLGLALKQRGVSLVRMDHAGKDETKGQRGGSAKSGDVDAVWRLTRQGDTESRFALTCEAHRHQVGHTKVMLTRRTDPLVHEAELVDQHAVSDPDEFRPTHLMERISRWMETYGPATRSVVVKGKDEAGRFNVPGKAQAKGRAFALLVAENYLSKTSGDEYEVAREYRQDVGEPPLQGRLDDGGDETW